VSGGGTDFRLCASLDVIGGLLYPRYAVNETSHSYTLLMDSAKAASLSFGGLQHADGPVVASCWGASSLPAPLVQVEERKDVGRPELAPSGWWTATVHSVQAPQIGPDHGQLALPALAAGSAATCKLSALSPHDPDYHNWEPITLLVIAPEATQGATNPFLSFLVLLFVAIGAGCFLAYFVGGCWLREERARSRRKILETFELEQDEDGGQSYTSDYNAL